MKTSIYLFIFLFSVFTVYGQKTVNSFEIKADGSYQPLSDVEATLNTGKDQELTIYGAFKSAVSHEFTLELFPLHGAFKPIFKKGAYYFDAGRQMEGTYGVALRYHIAQGGVTLESWSPTFVEEEGSVEIESVSDRRIKGNFSVVLTQSSPKHGAKKTAEGRFDVQITKTEY